jgi:hypothetical protein
MKQMGSLHSSGVSRTQHFLSLRLVSLRQMAWFFEFEADNSAPPDQSTTRIFHSQQKKGERNENDSIGDRRFSVKIWDKSHYYRQAYT